MTKNIEILSPAGSYESLKAAIAAGADAVYVGGSRFGARAYANNLTEEQLLELIHSDATPQQMEEIIEIAILQNCTR